MKFSSDLRSVRLATAGAYLWPLDTARVSCCCAVCQTSVPSYTWTVPLQAFTAQNIHNIQKHRSVYVVVTDVIIASLKRHDITFPNCYENQNHLTGYVGEYAN
jgi:hypothetical protein